MKNKDKWQTQDGTLVPIRVMPSTHLLRAIHLCERHRLTQVMELGFNSGGDVDADTLAYYMQWPDGYEGLVNEAERRGLIKRAVSPVAETTALTKRRRK